MTKVIVELDNRQVEQMVESLPMDEKIRLVRKLEKETLCRRWDNILKNIDERLKKYPINEKVIQKEIELARRQHYAKRRN